MEKKEISRRSFLKGTAIGALSIAGAGILGACAPNEQSDASTPSPEAATPSAVPQQTPASANEPTTSWRNAPDPIPDSQIAETYDADIIIIGMGYAGIAAARAAAEANQNARIIALEARKREEFWCVGHDIGHINSKILEKHGVPKVDEVEFLNNWQLQTHGKSNPSLVMQFVKNSGEAVDWILDVVPQEVVDMARVTYWPETSHSIRQLNNGLRYYPGTIQWWEDYWNGRRANNGEGLELKDIMNYNIEHIEKNLPGATLQFGVHGEQLIKDGGAVTGLVALDTDGNYRKYNARKFILATGGFGGDAEMCKDLLPSCVAMHSELDRAIGSAMDRDGSGHKMGVWAGGRMEAEPSTMGFDTTSGPDAFPSLWLDENVERYTNECFGGPEINGFINARLKRRQLVAVYDSTVTEMIQYNIPGHGSFDPTDQLAVDSLTQNLQAAYDAGRDSDNGFFAADDLETLADYIGYASEQKAKFLSQIAHYNELCEQGADTDFGKDPRLLFPISTGPFYAHVSAPTMGSGLVTTGGFVTDNNQQVLDLEYKPIPGLYASGNTCGMRFGPAYITPIPGVSIGMCLTLGRLCGLHCAEGL